MQPSSHTISIYVVNKPGVLSRITQVFARRSFNIDSLVVSPGVSDEFSRMTITAQGKQENLEQIIQQVSKLVDVVSCIEHKDNDSVKEELALIKISYKTEKLPQVLQIIEHFECKGLDSTSTSMIIRVVGTSTKLDALIDMLKVFKILEIVRTGKIAISRGDSAT